MGLAFVGGFGDEQMPRAAMEREWSDGRYLPIIFGFFALIATGSGAIEIARATTLIGEVESIAVTGVSAWATKKGFAG